MRKLTVNTALLCIFFVLLMCHACKDKNAITDNEIGFDTLKITDIYHLFNDTTKPNCNLQIQFIYPSTYANKKILQELQYIFVSKYFGDNFADMDPKAAAEAYQAQYISEYKEFEAEFGDSLNNIEINGSDGFYSFYETSKDLIHFNKGGILSFSIEYESYTGGAHDSHTLFGYVFDLKSNTLLKESDIFCEDCQEKITDLIVSKIMEANKVKNPKDLENVGYFDIGEIVPNGNFLIDDKGITYIYNEYDIAPYVMGKTKVFLPYNEISLYIKKDGPIAKLAGVQ